VPEKILRQTSIRVTGGRLDVRQSKINLEGWDRFEERTGKIIVFILVAIALMFTTPSEGAEPGLTQTNATAGQTGALTLKQPAIWQGEVGDGFRPDAQTLSLQTGPVAGLAIFGSRQEHDLTLLSLSYGHMLSGVVGKDHWYRGNWELRQELFGGAQVSPSRDWVVGLAPHLRYNIATGTRWIPYADAGAGVTATGIGHPDLSGTFEFNLQANTGVHWFVRDNVAITFEGGFLHLSCAGINSPNQGLNGVKAMFGVTWFF
jgi:lipid A 3-O-deacylase